MNHIFKKVRNKSSGQIVVISELTKFELAKNGAFDRTDVQGKIVAPMKVIFKYSALMVALSAVMGNAWAGEVCDGSIALGEQALGSTANGLNRAFACGHNNEASGDNSSAIGSGNKAQSGTSIAIGIGNEANEIDSIAFGRANQSLAIAASAVGYINSASGVWSNAFGTSNVASNEGANAVGAYNIASGKYSNAMGYGNVVSGTASSAFGFESKATHNNATAIGYHAETDRANSISVGRAGATKQITFVAAGTQATDAVNKSQLDTVNTTASNAQTTASKGLKVKANAGAVDTLALGDTLTWANGTNTTVAYDVASNTYKTNVVAAPTFAGQVAAASFKTGNIVVGTNNKITGLTAGAANADAVNFGQLNSLVSVLGGSFNGLGAYTAPTYTIQNKSYSNVGAAFGAVNLKLDNLQTQLDGLPTGIGADGKSAYDIAKGLNASIGTESEWIASLKGDKGDTGLTGAAGKDGLNGLNGKDGAKGDKGDTGLTGAKGDTGAQGIQGEKGDQGIAGRDGKDGRDGTNGINGKDGLNGINGKDGKDAFSLAVEKGFIGNEQDWLDSLKAAGLSEDAVRSIAKTGDQQVINETKTYIDQKVADMNNPYFDAQGEADIDDSQHAKAGGQSAIAIGQGAKANGNQSISIGTGNQVSGNHSGAIGDPSVVTGNSSYSVGNDNRVSGDNTFVLGNNVNTSAKNAIILGNDSTSDRDNTVSVGATGKERQIINVRAGTASSDAVNVKQMKDSNAATLTSANAHADAGDATTLNQAKQHATQVGTQTLASAQKYTDSKIADLENTFSRLDKSANAGIASALAIGNLPQPTGVGRNMLSIGTATHNGEQAIAVGVSGITTDNKYVLKGGFSTNTDNDVSSALSVGFQW